ncbi:transcriptional protein SWT1 isoform X2 [Sceloporus undulatus]|uniref:transcriptional protein SWT1 isoform X2 n=1 Tax=Sceloporus undulatus TaxID=8520 RepID=UPI001C4D7A64|nr:transcriptional protein SWT1 isoform X2 [Sceloporus undulatus]
MAKKHKKSSKKDNASDSKNHEDPKIGSNHVKDHPSQRLDNATRCTKAKNSLSFIEATTKDLQKNISKETQHIGGTLMSPEQREKITIRFKKKADHGGKRSNTDLVAASFSKEDSDRDVYSEPDVKRKRQESHDLRILNTRKKKIKDKAEHSSVKNIIVRSMLPKECSFLPKKKSLKLDEFSIKQNSSKEPYLPTSAVNLSGPKLHMQACREETLEKSKRTSLQHPSNKDEMRYKPLRPVMDQSNFLKYKEKKQLCNDSTNNVCHLRTQRSKYEPVAFQANQSSETSCHPFSAFEATENTDPDQEMRIVEVLHAARIGQKMALPVVQTCGELTSMDIDLPDDESNKFAKSVAGLNTLIVVDTNIMIRHLEFIKSLKNSVIPGIGNFVLVIPWVVLQELDNLKRGKMLANVGQKAIPAVNFIYMCLKKQDPKLWGQSMQLASQKTHDFIVENNDDRVLQCCLQYKNLFPQVEIVLLTDDKNLCNKALVSEIKACSKIDLVTALQKLVPKNVVITQDASICQSLLGKDTSCHKVEASSTDDLSVIILDTKKCLGKVLSSILETELKIAYGELWTEVVYHNPPWTLDNVLDCYKKHWMAVFGMVIPRSFFSTIEYLYEHLCKAEIIQGSTITFVLQESKMLLETFSSRSNYDGVLSQAITEVDKLLETLKKQGTEPDTSGVLKSTSGETACEKMEDVAFIQNTQTVDKSLSSKPLAKGNRHMEIWSVLQILWDRINGFSLQVFQKLDLSSVTTTEKMASFKEAFVDLQKLMSGVNEILSGIQKVLLPNSSFQDIWTLYNFLINAEVNNDTKFTAEELYECISQKVYRN